MKYHSSAFLCASLSGAALFGSANGHRQTIRNITALNSDFFTALNAAGIVPTPIVENSFLVQLPSTFDVNTMQECTSYDVDKDGMVPHEQVLGCSLFHDIATLGAFKAEEDLNKRPTESPLTGAIFDTRGIAKMIQDGCFRVNLVKSLQDNSFSYSTLQTYESQVSTSYSLDVSALASYATVAATAGYQTKTDTFVQDSGVNQASGGEMYSEYIFSRLKNTCIANGQFRDYMTQEAQSLFSDMTENPTEVAKFKLWREKFGLVVPTMWYFGAYKALSSKVSFVSKESVTSSETSEAMNAAMGVDHGTLSTEVAVEMQNAFSTKMSTHNSEASLSVEASSNSNCQDIWDSDDRGSAIRNCNEHLGSNILHWGTAIKVGQFTPIDYGVTTNKEEMAYTMFSVGAKCFPRSGHFAVRKTSDGNYLSCTSKASDDDQGCAWKSGIEHTFETVSRDPSYSGFKSGYEAFDINDSSQGWLDRGHCHSSTSVVRLTSDKNHCGSKHWGIKNSKYLCEDGNHGNNCLAKDATVVNKSGDWVEVEQVDVHGLMVDLNHKIQLCCPAGEDC